MFASFGKARLSKTTLNFVEKRGLVVVIYKSSFSYQITLMRKDNHKKVYFYKRLSWVNFQKRDSTGGLECKGYFKTGKGLRKAIDLQYKIWKSQETADRLLL